MKEDGCNSITFHFEENFKNMLTRHGGNHDMMTLWKIKKVFEELKKHNIDYSLSTTSFNISEGIYELWSAHGWLNLLLKKHKVRIGRFTQPQPGTELYDKAEEDGIFLGRDDKHKETDVVFISNELLNDIPKSEKYRLSFKDVAKILEEYQKVKPINDFSPAKLKRFIRFINRKCSRQGSSHRGGSYTVRNIIEKEFVPKCCDRIFAYSFCCLIINIMVQLGLLYNIDFEVSHNWQDWE